MTDIPRIALILGLAGLIPFVWGALTLLAPDLRTWSVATLGPQMTGRFILQSYGVVILPFMAGVIWGFAARETGTDNGTGAVATWLYPLSVIPALWVFFLAGGAPSDAGIIALMAGFIGLVALDALAWQKQAAPPWWLVYRLVLTTVVAACLAIGAYA